MERIAQAYRKGYDMKYAGVSNPPELKMHYFKPKDDLPRVRCVLGFLRNIIPAHVCRTLLDIGSGRGAFLFPLMRDFPDLEVTSMDILPHRVELLECIRKGGFDALTPVLDDVCHTGLPSDSFDIVTALEVLEHIPDTSAAVGNIVRMARKYVLVSVPSHPDDNPEHIHLFSPHILESLFLNAGCSKVKFHNVHNHIIMIATL